MLGFMAHGSSECISLLLRARVRILARISHVLQWTARLARAVCRTQKNFRLCEGRKKEVACMFELESDLGCYEFLLY